LTKNSQANEWKKEAKQLALKHPKIWEKLSLWGIKHPQIIAFIKSYGAAKMEEMIDYTMEKERKNIAGFFITALAENYFAPKAQLKKAQKKRKERSKKLDKQVKLQSQQLAALKKEQAQESARITEEIMRENPDIGQKILAKSCESSYFITMSRGERNIDKLFNDIATKYVLVTKAELLYPKAFEVMKEHYEKSINKLENSLKALGKGILLEEQETNS
jgi:hypothetical protein